MANTQIDKYLSDDTVFNIMNKKFLSLPPDKVKRNNVYLEAVTALIERMKSKDSLFKKAYNKITFCGSFYKGTKVGSPNEFDLNIILELPIPPNDINLCSTRPAFTKIQINSTLCGQSNNVPSKYILSNEQKKLLLKLLSNNYLDPDKFRQWIEGILSKVILELPKFGDWSKLIVQNEYGIFDFRIKKSGPAFTIILNIPNDEAIHVDLAPALAFRKTKINGSTAKLNKLHEYRNTEWFAIPLPSTSTAFNDHFHWRLSFCHQEREILSKHGRVKPVIRLMKKLKDVQTWRSMASYFIETLFLNRLSKLQEDLNKIPLTLFFFRMLKELHSVCEQHKLEYFWDAGYNLLGKISKKEMDNIANRLKNIIQNIEKYAMSDTFILAKFVLNRDELELLKIEYFRRQNQEQTEHYQEQTEVNSNNLRERSTCILS